MDRAKERGGPLVDRAKERGGPPGYDGFCRNRGLQAGVGRALRFRTPDEGTTVVHDLIRGDVYFWQSLMAATLIPAIPIALPAGSTHAYYKHYFYLDAPEGNSERLRAEILGRFGLKEVA